MTQPAMSETTSRRKDAHLDLCATGEVEPEGSDPLLGQVAFLHEALPDLSMAELDLSARFLGRTLAAPLLITGMTGGSDRAGVVNRDLARAAQAAGIAFGLGSQRAMSEDDSRRASYAVRESAPNVVLLGNIGLAEARRIGPSGCLKLAESVGADGFCLHLNVAQELTQPEGDRDFRGGLSLVRELVAAFGERLVVKETGCGIGPSTARRLAAAGVRNVDVSGAGGTSWVRVEALRASPEAARLGEEFSRWGIPTAAAVASVRPVLPTGCVLIASGGLRTGLDAARAIRLGADLAGVALPVFRAQQQGGFEGASRELAHLREGLARTLLLTGSRDLAALRRAPAVLGLQLDRWLNVLGGAPATVGTHLSSASP